MPAHQAADHVHPPDHAVPGAQAEAEGTVSDQSLAGDEREGISTGRVLAPIGDDVAREAIAVTTAPAGFDPGADALDRRGDASDVDVSDGMHGGTSIRMSMARPIELVNTVPYGYNRAVPTDKTPVPEARLSTADWESAALDALAENGLAGVAIEPLARRLGVTKGSFYWHFPDREALLAAALARWEKSHTEHVIDAAEGVRDPRQRLASLIGRVLAGGRSDRIHIALATSNHPLVRETLVRVTRRRIAYLESCYVQLGQPRLEANRSALLAYAAYVGLVHLRLEAPKELPAREAAPAYVEHLIGKLVP